MNETDKKDARQISVLVLMSTYNGEAFLEEQLDSILMQKCRTTLLIRDDGSTDRTFNILKKYAGKYPYSAQAGGILPIIKGKNLGASASFFKLLGMAEDTAKKTKQNYFAFADQDDIWKADKLSTAVRKIQAKEQERKCPYLYASAVQPVSQNGELLQAAVRYKKVKPSFGNALVENICTGCTCVFNLLLLQKLTKEEPKAAIMHDFWLYLTASAFGEVIYDKVPYILYRQHDKNTLGMASTHWESCKRRIKNFRKHRYQLTAQAAEFLNKYGKMLEPNREKLLLDFIKQKPELAFGQKIYRQRGSDNLIMKLLLLLKLL